MSKLIKTFTVNGKLYKKMLNDYLATHYLEKINFDVYMRRTNEQDLKIDFDANFFINHNHDVNDDAKLFYRSLMITLYYQNENDFFFKDMNLFEKLYSREDYKESINLIIKNEKRFFNYINICNNNLLVELYLMKSELTKDLSLFKQTKITKSLFEDHPEFIKQFTFLKDELFYYYLSKHGTSKSQFEHVLNTIINHKYYDGIDLKSMLKKLIKGHTKDSFIHDMIQVIDKFKKDDNHFKQELSDMMSGILIEVILQYSLKQRSFDSIIIFLENDYLSDDKKILLLKNLNSNFNLDRVYQSNISFSLSELSALSKIYRYVNDNQIPDMNLIFDTYKNKLDSNLLYISHYNELLTKDKNTFCSFNENIETIFNYQHRIEEVTVLKEFHIEYIKHLILRKDNSFINLMFNYNINTIESTLSFFLTENKLIEFFNQHLKKDELMSLILLSIYHQAPKFDKPYNTWIELFIQLYKQINPEIESIYSNHLDSMSIADALRETFKDEFIMLDHLFQINDVLGTDSNIHLKDKVLSFYQQKDNLDLMIIPDIHFE